MRELDSWVENDYNPFILFNENGYIESLNKEAEYFLSKTSTKEIFNLAKTYASISYGFKTTLLDIDFSPYKIYGFTVGYEDDHTIGIKLYKCTPQTFKKPKGEKVNIYALLDLCKSAILTQKKIDFTRDFDPTLPNLLLHVGDFTKLITNSYHYFINSQEIVTKLSLKTGEYIKFNSQKYPIFTIEIIGDTIDNSYTQEIKNISATLGCMVNFTKTSIIITSALVECKD